MSSSGDRARARWCVRSGAAVVLLAISLAAAAVDLRTGAGTASHTGSSAIDLEFSGCAAVVAGPACELGEQRILRLWLPHGSGARDAVQLYAGETVLPPTTTSALTGGTRVELHIPPGTTSLRAVRRGHGETWRLGIVEAHPDIARARQLRAAGKPELAAAHLHGALQRRPGDRLLRLSLLGLEARLALGRGRLDQAVAGLRQTIAAAGDLGRVSVEVDDGFALAYVLGHRLRRIAAAGELLRQLERVAIGYPEGATQWAYHTARHAFDVGDHRTSFRLAHQALEGAQQLGMAAIEQASAQQLALTLASVGRTVEALAWQTRAERNTGGASPADACGAARMCLNRVWISDAAVEPCAFEQARACADPFTRRNLVLTEARLALRARDLGRASRLLAGPERETAASGAGVATHLERLALQGELALLRRRPGLALRHYDRLALMARAGAHVDAEREALIGRGQALEALDRAEDAIASYRAADALVRTALASVPLGEGRISFAGRHDLAVRHLVAALVRVGRTHEAVRVARLARRRALRAALLPLSYVDDDPGQRHELEQALGLWWDIRQRLDDEAADDWKRPRRELDRAIQRRAALLDQARVALDEAVRLLERRAARYESTALRDPPPGESLLVFFPGPHGLLGFAVSSREVAAADLGPPPGAAASPAAVAGQLLSPFARFVDDARTIRVLSYGAADILDVHALPWRGKPLLAHATVLYSLDVDGAADAPRPAGGGALVVIDPTEELTEAQDEGAAAGRTLPAPVVTLHGLAATRGQVLRWLAQVASFHFAGHSDSGGTDGQDSALWLADDGRLSMTDLQMLSAVPATVVLSSCRGAATATASAPVGVGLAQTFVLMGTRTVVAATRKVEDALSRRLMAEVYRARDQPASIDARRFRAAQLTLASAEPAADWASYRVYVQ
jgi:cellulose synthase operon protein C